MEIRKYSDSFKKKVIREIAKGNFSSIAAAARHFNVNKYETIIKWLRQAGREDLLPKIIIVE
ncbi:MAG: helix-turn-helix domain-containing protein [Syntrophothermus sp.]